ncbi:unnamed protein product [Closterium sp. NIES-65]|nr:unnamed protein product [Closterium sp. NIES-65]
MAAVSAATARVAMAAAPVQSAVLASSYSSRSSFAACPVSRPSRAAGAKRLPAGIRCHGEESEAAVDGRAFRRALNKSDNYNRSGFGYKKEMLERMEQEYTSDVVKTLRENNNEYTWGDVTVMLAESLGFCWGVERAVQMAYEARKQFPDQKIWVTNEIIHNPTVNDKMESMGMSFIETRGDGSKDFSVVGDDNVVVLPAFGASLQEVTMFHDRNVQMVDTTCPWVSKVTLLTSPFLPPSFSPPSPTSPPPPPPPPPVPVILTSPTCASYPLVGLLPRIPFLHPCTLLLLLPYSSRAPPPNLPRPPVPPLACPVRCVCGEQVWDTVDKHKRGQFTSVIHGKYAHEETVATASYAGTYIVVKDMKEAHYVCDYILGGKLDGSSGTREGFLQKFAKAVSKGFDPDTDLERLGIANQTTMLKGETEMIGKLLERTMMSKFGATNVNSHFMSFNTICDATQERQDAMYALVERPMDLMIVVGGLNSSNTSHLQEIAEHKGIPSYWVDEPTRIGPGNRVTHKLYYGELKETEGFLPPGPIRIGVTSGASTPDKCPMPCTTFPVACLVCQVPCAMFLPRPCPVLRTQPNPPLPYAMVVEDVLNAIFAIKKDMPALQPVA